MIWDMHTKNDVHIMYSWDIEHNGQNFLSFWTIFCPFTPLTTWKIKILKNWKKLLEISLIYNLHKCAKNHYHMLYCSLDIAYNRCNCFVIFYFGLFFALLPPSPPTAWKIKIRKMKQLPGDVILHHCTKNHMLFCS